MLDVGRVCVKIAGRDANLKCVIVDVKDGRYEIDGQTRRRWVNGMHLEPTKETVDVKKGASHADVVKAFKGLGIELVEKKSKKAADKPKRVKKAKVKETKKPAKAKKAEPKTAKAEKEAKVVKAESKSAEDAKPGVKTKLPARNKKQ